MVAAGRRVTMADVARQAGVSRTTVSFVLGNRHDMRISAQARERVMRVARELGYRPNLTARGLRTSVTGTIGLVSDTIATEPFAGEVIHGALDGAGAQGRVLFIAETEGDAATEAEVVAGLLDRQVDAVIYAAMYTREVEPPAGLRGRPLVLLNCVANGFDAPSVVPDERAAGRTAARALLDAGHRDRVHVIGGHHITDRSPAGVLAGHERMRGILDAFDAAGARLSGVTECAWEPDEGYRHIRALLRSRVSGPPPTALICSNDRLALGAYQALQEAGLTVPDDVSVVSFDDSVLSRWLRPTLSSVALPHYELGRTAVDLLLAAELEPVTHRIPMLLRARSSIAVPTG